jgi:LAO/AO transport system kinase
MLRRFTINKRFSAIISFQSRSLLTQTQVSDRVDRLLGHERSALSRTITLIESSRDDHRACASQIMRELLSRTPQRQNKAMRIGICGAPGAGKSSVIEKLGVDIVKQGKRLAVLAVDPSS